jgi:hypothetical protein
LNIKKKFVSQKIKSSSSSDRARSENVCEKKAIKAPKLHFLENRSGAGARCALAIVASPICQHFTTCTRVSSCFSALCFFERLLRGMENSRLVLAGFGFRNKISSRTLAAWKHFLNFKHQSEKKVA